MPHPIFQSKSSMWAALIIAAAIIAGFDFNGTTLTGFLLSALALMILWPLSKDGVPLWQGVLPNLMLVWLLGLAASIWWSTLPFISWFYFWAFAGLPIVFLAWQGLTEPDRAWAIVTKFLPVGGAILAIWGIAQVIQFDGTIRPRGPLIDPNAYAATLNLFWFAICAKWWHMSVNNLRSKTASLYLLALLLLSFSLFASSSRGALLSWLVLVPVLLWYFSRAPAFRFRFGILASVLLISYFGAAATMDYKVSAAAQDALSGGESLQMRFYLWEMTLEMWKENPWLGTGLGSWGSYYPAYRGIRDTSTTGYFAHNDYLQLAQEIGLLGLIVFLMVVSGMIWLTLRILARRGQLEFAEAIGLMLGVMAVSLHALVNFIFYYAFMNILIGLFAGRAWQIMGSKSQGMRLKPWMGQSARRTVVAFSACLVFAQLLLHQVAELLNCDHPVINAVQRVAPRVNEYEVALFVHALRPDEPIPLNIVLANMRQSLSEAALFGSKIELEVFNEVINRYEWARQRWPTEPRFAAEQAMFLLENQSLLPHGKALEMAEKVAFEGLKIDPRHPESTIALAKIQYFTHGTDHGLNILAQAIPHAFRMRDRRLMEVAYVRILIAPKRMIELAEMENKLRGIHPNNEVGHLGQVNIPLYDDVAAKLRKIVKAHQTDMANHYRSE